MKTIAVVLLVLGGLALVYGGIDYSRNRTMLKMGSMEIAATEHRSIPIPAIAGVIVLVGGFALLFAGNRRSGRT
jgi:uncharacterized membrane protein YidH (DUF202 family)